MLEAGLFYEKLQHLLSISPKRIAIIKKGLSIDHRMGRPPKITQPMLDYTEMLSLTNARLTDRHITSLVNEKFSTNISKTTIARIRRKLGFIYRPPLAKQELNELQKQMRLEFCNWVLQNRSHVNNIVFSDESRFEKVPDNTWRRIKREIWNDSCFCEKQKFTPGIMVWGAIEQGFRTPLMKCSGSVDVEEYINIMERSGLFTTCDMKFGRYKWVYMHDGAPCHTSSQTTNWLSQRAVVIPGWPPNSPDLNLIENIWAIIKRKLKRVNWEENRDIYLVVCNIWNEID